MNSLETPDSSYTASANVFLPIQGTGTKLGDIKVLPVDPENDTIKASNHEVQLIASEAGGTGTISAEAMQEFWTAKGYDQDALDEMISEGADLSFCFYPSKGHWFIVYDRENLDSSFPMDDFVIPSGNGLLVYAHGIDSGIKLQYAGQVGKQPLRAHVDDDCYILCGNAAPVDFQLKDFAFEAEEDGDPIKASNIELALIGNAGFTASVADEEFVGALTAFWKEKGYDEDALNEMIDEQADLSFCYRTAQESWFLVYDNENFDHAYPMNDFKIPASIGLYVYAHGIEGGAKFVMPPAISEK